MNTMHIKQLCFYLRDALVDAMTRNQHDRLVALFYTCDTLHDAACAVGDGTLMELTTHYLDALNDHYTGGPWTVSIPTDAELSALFDQNVVQPTGGSLPRHV